MPTTLPPPPTDPDTDVSIDSMPPDHEAPYAEYPIDEPVHDALVPAPAAELPAVSIRTMPHNLEAEKGLLGAILLNNRAHEKVSEYLRPEHFAYERHGQVYEAISKLIERGQVADGITLQRYFEHDQNLAEIGGPAYLGELAGAAASVINAGEYGRIVYDLFLKRQLINLGEDMVNRAYGGEIDEIATRQIETAEQNLYDLATAGDYEGGFQDFKTSIIEAISSADAAHRREGGLAGTSTGLKDVDTLLGGLHPSDLIILAGRPSMGKTALATNIAYNAAKDFHYSKGEEGAVVGFFSLEMSAEQLAGRILSEQSEIPSDKMRKGLLSNEEFTTLAQCAQTLHDIPFFIDDTPALTVSALRTRARRLQRQHNLGLIIVDYLQLISGSPGKSDGRVNEVSEITRGLKTLAKELSVPVIALSQLSRAVESREPPRPQLSDLRESGSIEQDADVVTFVYREEYYMERKKPGRRAEEDEGKYFEREGKWEEALASIRGIADLIVAKQRHGPIGDVKLQFTGEFARFGDLDPYHHER
jgi:replicative DNA helicase